MKTHYRFISERAIYSASPENFFWRDGVLTGKRNKFRDPIAVLTAAWLGCTTVAAADNPLIKDVEFQPLSAQGQRVVEALDYIGSPVSPETKTAFQRLQAQSNTEVAVEQIQKLFDPLCLFLVEIN